MNGTEKHSTVGQYQPTISNILELNDDCLLTIFRYLCIAEMAVASDACKRFRDIAIDAYKLESRRKPVSLRNNKKEKRLEASAILRHFGPQLQRISVDFGEKGNHYFFEMIIEKCCSERLTEVDLSSEIVSRESVYLFKNKFKNIRLFGMDNVAPNSAQLDCFEEHFPAMQHLRVYGKTYANRSLIRFLTVNPQIKHLSLLYRNDIENAQILLPQIAQQLPDLEELELEWMPGVAEPVAFEPKIFHALKQLRIYNFGRGMNMQSLGISNVSVEEMELRDGSLDNGVMDFISNYQELKKLNIQKVDYPVDYYEMAKMAAKLPKLTEFAIFSFLPNMNRDKIADFVLNGESLTSVAIEEMVEGRLEPLLPYMKKRLHLTNWTVEFLPVYNALLFEKKMY